jgi:hypothetical protein
MAKAPASATARTGIAALARFGRRQAREMLGRDKTFPLYAGRRSAAADTVIINETTGVANGSPRPVPRAAFRGRNTVAKSDCERYHPQSR